MKKLLILIVTLTLSHSIAFAQTRAQQDQDNNNEGQANPSTSYFESKMSKDLSSPTVVDAIEKSVNDSCKCGGTPEACCKACPETCDALTTLGLSMAHVEQSNAWKVVPRQ